MMTAERECGKRVKGGAYMVTPLAAGGVPLENFIVDQPQIVNPISLGLSPIGVTLVEVNGVYHVFDIVGRNYYPNVADFIEEAKVLGISRRIPQTVDFSLLTKKSRLVLVHEHAWINNFMGIWQTPEWREDMIPCPTHKHETLVTDYHCAAYWWHDVDGSDAGVRNLKSTHYFARHQDEKMEHQIAVFMTVPIHHITIIKDPDDGTHVQTMAKVVKTSLPITLEND